MDKSSSLLFLTGGNGFIGFRVLLDALSAGYQVRAAVRSEEKSSNLLEIPALRSLGKPILDKLSFVVIPDIVVPDAYMGKLDGVTHIIHAGCPLPLPGLDPETGVYQPSIKGTENILKAAQATSSVKRVVITSSISGNMSWPPEAGARTKPSDRVDPPRDLDTSDLLGVYAAAKAASLRAADEISKKPDLHFTISHVFPGYTFGRDERATKAEELFVSSNGLMLGLLQGVEFPFPRLDGAVHIDDLVNVHLKALERNDNTDWGASFPVSHKEPWQIVQKRYPQHVRDGTFKEGNQPNVGEQWDASNTEVELSMKFKSHEQMVTDLIDQFLDLKSRSHYFLK